MTDEVVQVIENPVIVQVVVGQVLANGGGGGVTDGDKGDITVSGSGAAWTIDAGAVSLSKMADLATSTILGRATAGTGVPEALTAAQVRTILNVADGATANASDASLRDRSTHTGTQAAGTITGLAAVATSGSAADLSGTLAAARLPAFTGDATTPGGSTVLTLATVNANVGSFGLAGSVAQFVVNAKGLITSAVNVAISIAATAISDSTAAGRAMLTAATAAAQTALLDVFTSGAKGLVPPSGGGTTNFLRADGTFAAPPGGGSPGGSSGEVQYNNGGAFAGAADVEIEGGQLRLPVIAPPAAPASGGVKLFGRDVGGRLLPAIMGPSGLDTALQPFLGRNRISLWFPYGSGTTVFVMGTSALAVGTATGASYSASGNRHAKMRRIEYLVTTPSTSAVAGWREQSAFQTVGGNAAGDGGFHMVLRWAPATGVANASHRAFAGMRGATGAPTDVDPSTIANIIGMGYDAADTNIQFMHNDGSGTATKIDLGASFPKPSADRTAVYEIALFSPPGTTQSVSYTVTDLVSGAVASGTVTTDLPSTTQVMAARAHTSVGGVSAVSGVAIFGFYLETDY